MGTVRRWWWPAFLIVALAWLLVLAFAEVAV